MPYGVPYSDNERRARHKAMYGEETEPPAKRYGYGEQKMGYKAPDESGQSDFADGLKEWLLLPLKLPIDIIKSITEK